MKPSFTVEHLSSDNNNDRSLAIGTGTVFYVIYIQINKFWGIFSFYVRYSTLLHLLPLRFHCVGGCWDQTKDSVATLALPASRSNH
jgi:hypothetical protein